MIKSMTGFARSDVQAPGGTLTWELRSVNHRYLETQIRLPEGFRPVENDARQIVARTLRRGKVEASLTFRVSGETPHAPVLNLAYARELMDHAQALAKMLASSAAIDPVDILRWPGVLQEEQARPDILFPMALEGLGQAVNELDASRAREGVRLHGLLESRCVEIQSRVVAVQSRLPLVLAGIREKLGERVKSLTTALDPQRLEQEIVLLAQKIDVSEELDRLVSHIAEFRDAMAKPGEPAGRRLDFLLQEFNREANTLASKSADAETTRHAVDLKVIIEQMREQVQNVE